MNVIHKCKVILRMKFKSNSSISLKDRAMAVLEHDLHQKKLINARKKIDKEDS